MYANRFRLRPTTATFTPANLAVMCINPNNPFKVVLSCHSFSAKFHSSLNFIHCQWHSCSRSFQVCLFDMATQTAREPPPETTRTFPNHGTESPKLKAFAQWHHFTRIWTETITEFRAEMESTRWGHSTRTTFYLSLCCTWAAVLVFWCTYVPSIPLPYADSEHCAPDGSFRLESFSLLAPTWFFQVVIGFGSLDFTTVKAIDVVWDVVSDISYIECVRKLLTSI